MQIKIVQSIAGHADPRYELEDFGYRPGEVVDVDDELAASWIDAGIAAGLEEPTPPEPPPTGDPVETNAVQWPVKEIDTDIALASTPMTVVVGSIFLIDLEYMVVIDVSNPDNPKVTRGTNGSGVATHEAGAAVSIWGPADPVTASKGSRSRKNKKRQAAPIEPASEPLDPQPASDQPEAEPDPSDSNDLTTAESESEKAE